jgi:hypothetical protein
VGTVTQVRTGNVGFDKIDESPAKDARARIRDELADEYADALAGGANLGRGTVFHDGSRYWLGDGVHRIAAGRKQGKRAAEFEIREGGYDEAFAFACRANDTHGGRTSNDDKRARCEAYWRRHWKDPRPADRAVALACNVSYELAGKVRRSLEESGALPTVGNAQASDGRIVPSRRFAIPDPEPAAEDPPHVNGHTPTVGPLTDPDPDEEDDEDPVSTVETKAEPDPPALKVPKRLEPDFSAKAWFASVVKKIGGLLAECDEAAKTRGGQLLPMTQIRADLRNLQNEIRNAAPAAVCPYCNGKGCGECHDLGWMTKERFGAVPAEKRRRA